MGIPELKLLGEVARDFAATHREITEALMADGATREDAERIATFAATLALCGMGLDPEEEPWRG